MRDNKAYEYARWADDDETMLRASSSAISVIGSFSAPRAGIRVYETVRPNRLPPCSQSRPVLTFNSPACKGIDFICWLRPSLRIEHRILSFSPMARAFRVGTTSSWSPPLKRGSLYVLPLTPNGQAAAGAISRRYFQSRKPLPRYRHQS